MPTTITLIAKTHRTACLDGCGEADASAYDGALGDYLEDLTDELAEEGIKLEINLHDVAAVSYRVEADDEAEESRGHEVFQGLPSFWDRF